VVMWNRGAAKCEALKAEFGGLVTVASSPGEVLPTLISLEEIVLVACRLSQVFKACSIQ